jgi:tetratricopeptide (TPR) repeat protein
MLAGSLVAQPTHPLLGRISFPTSGSAAAQPAFIRGVLLLHSFEYDDAISAFREAQRIDPGFAMAFWGEGMCFNQPLWGNENVTRARAALARLAATPSARAGRAATVREKAYLDAVERLFGDGSKVARDRAYLDRMAELSRAYPEDDEAAVFHALALLATIPIGERHPAISLRAGTIASAVLKKNPEHPGAAHYALHAYDDGEHAALGLTAARIYARIAPASSHARHMPSHVFLPLGMWDEASASDQSAFSASVDRARQQGLSPAQHDFHALAWLHYEYLQQGRFAEARTLVPLIDRAIAAPNGPAGAGSGAPGVSGSGPTPHQHAESEIGRGFSPASLKGERASLRARQIIESGRWDEMQGQGSFDNVDELFALGLSSVKTGDLARAEAVVTQLHGAQRAAPDADNRRLAVIMLAEVDGMLQLAKGRTAAARAALARAAQLEAAAPKPVARPYPIKPAGELYAEALLTMGEATAAVAQFQAALQRTPRRAAALIGLARAANAAGMASERARAAKEFLAVWHGADAGRPEPAEARALLAR